MQEPSPIHWKAPHLNTDLIASAWARSWVIGRGNICRNGANVRLFWISSRNSQHRSKGKLAQVLWCWTMTAWNYLCFIQRLKIHYIHAKPKAAANVKVYKMILLVSWTVNELDFPSTTHLSTAWMARIRSRVLRHHPTADNTKGRNCFRSNRPQPPRLWLQWRRLQTRLGTAEGRRCAPQSHDSYRLWQVLRARYECKWILRSHSHNTCPFRFVS